MGKFNEYSQKAIPADNDTLMIYDEASKTNKLSPFSGIWNWIVGKLTNAVISNLQTSNQTVLRAINELNSKALSDIRNLQEFSFKMPLDERVYSVLLMYGATSKNYPFMYMVFIDVKSNARGVFFHKIFDALSRTFEGTYDDATTTLTIKSSETVWAGLRIIAIK